jgi:ArsR family transcriptional regulator
MRWDGTYPHQARVLRALAHPVRLQIAEILSREEACICHLEAALGLRQAYISQQVGVLRGAGLLAERREGVFVYLRLANPHIDRLLRSSRRVVGQAARASPRRRTRRCACPRCRADRSGKAGDGIPRAGRPGARTRPRG